MSKATFTWYRILTIICLVLTSVMGLTVMVVCGYDTVRILHDSKLEKKIERDVYLIEKIDSDGYSSNGYKYSLPDKDKYEVEGYHANETETNGPKEHEGAHTYFVILMLCLVSGFILGFVQFVMSVSVICSCSPDLPQKIKSWLVVNVFVFLLGILCLVVPLSYNPSLGQHYNLEGFSEYVKKKLCQLMEVRDTENFHQELYFYVFGANESVLLLCIIVIGGLLRCGMKPDYSNEKDWY